MSKHWERVRLGQCGRCGQTNPNAKVINYCNECLHDLAIEERRKWQRDMRIMVYGITLIMIVVATVAVLELLGVIGGE